MTRRSWGARTMVTTVLAICALVVTGLPVTAAPTDPPPDGGDAGLSTAAQDSARAAAERDVSLDREVLEQLDEGGSTNFWVDLDAKADLSKAAEIDDWAERGRYVYDQLVETAQTSQGALRLGLTTLGVDHEAFWISNSILVRNADQSLLDAMVGRPEVAAIRTEETVTLPDPVQAQSDAAITAVEWGIANVRADQVWSQFGVRGEGIVVGNIDSGVEYTHPALVNQYRGNQGGGVFDHDYNWWDPATVCPADEPCDNNNHGTHTMGTMVGDDGAGNQIGVAPRARWIAAKGCESNSCSDAALLSSGQFMLAPTDMNGQNPRPELRPHVVNNSWGSPGGNTFYDATVAAWTAAGIFGVFANTNSGPGCGSAGSPADGPDAYAVGAHAIDNLIADFSSRGPGRDGQLRPHISAPGAGVRSSITGHAYAIASGTSMAAPHTAGAVALMLSAAGTAVEPGETRQALDGTAVDTEDLTCGGVAGNNNVYGEGRLDALEATIRLAIHTGITGVVTDGVNGQPLAGVSVAVADRPGVVTRQDGRFTIRALPGTYTLELSKFGYFGRSVPDVVVTEQGFTTADVALDRAPNGNIAGRVTDERSGHTIPVATVRLLDVPVDLSATTDADGNFQLTGVPAGSYDVMVTTTRPGQWWPAQARVTVDADATVRLDVGVPRAKGVERVSVTSDGAEVSQGTTFYGQISADGRYVTFTSRARDLVDGPVTGGINAFVHDRHTGVTELVPASAARAENSIGTTGPTISADGRYVAASGPPGHLEERLPELPATPRSWPPLDLEDRAYLFDRTTGDLELLSVNSRGESVGNGYSVGPVITPDGRFSAFASSSSHLADRDLPICRSAFDLQVDRCQQIAVHDRATGQTDVVSVSSADEPANTTDAGSEIAMTPDGRFVVFKSTASNLVGEPTNPGHDFFLHDRDTGQTEWVSRLELPNHLLASHSHPQISDDGRVIAYARGLAPGAVYDRTTGRAELLPQPRGDIVAALTVSRAAGVSGDGRFITYVHAGLDAEFEVIPELTGVFVLDRETGQVELVRHVDVATGPLGVSEDGRSILLGSTSDVLAPGDTNGAPDLYVQDRDFDADRDHSLFAVWDLSVHPQRPRPGEPVEVTAKVKNVGDVSGDYQASLLVDGVREPAAQAVTVAPGQVTEVSFTVTRSSGEHRVRIGQAAGGFEVQSGTLTGELLDANDGRPVEGATVTAVRGDESRTATTLGAAYHLPGLALGTWTVTVEAGSFVTETFEVTVTGDGQQITRDLALRTGVPKLGQKSIELSLPAGSARSVEVGLANTGTADLSWSAFGWNATTREQPSILMYTSSTNSDTHIDQALGRLGLAYTAVRETNDCVGSGAPPRFEGLLDEFPAALASRHWDVVILDQWCNIWALQPATAFSLYEYVQAGGKLIIRSESLRHNDELLWDALGVEYAGTPDLREGGDGHFGADAFPVHWWKGEHSLFRTPLAVPEFDDGRVRGAPNVVGPRRELVRASDGFAALAGYSLPARLDHSALVLGNDDRTLYNAFWYGDSWSHVPGESGAPVDTDRDGIADPVELWVNSISHIGGLTLNRWLSAEQSGTITPGGSAAVKVSIDASGLAPGTYTGTVAVTTSAAREPLATIPVTVHVTACDRTISGSHGGPLTVTSGVTCLADGATVTGPVAVSAGASLLAGKAVIAGPVNTDRAQYVVLAGTTVTGQVRVQGTTVQVRIAGARLDGAVTLARNTTAATPIVVSANAIQGSLRCEANEPPPVDDGSPNVVTGRSSGQCAALTRAAPSGHSGRLAK